eukprot:SAG11_NODE_344_length_10440_cov_10.595494_4_plen_582_part_00
MEDGGGDALTPQMVLAAARPPLEALGARAGRATVGIKGNMGLDGAGGAEFAPDGDVRAQGRLEQEPHHDRLSWRGGEEKSAPTTLGAPLGDGGETLGSSVLSPHRVPGGRSPTLICLSARCASTNLVELESDANHLRALAGVLPTSKLHTRTPPHTASSKHAHPQSDQLRTHCKQHDAQGGQEDVARTQVTTEVQRGLKPNHEGQSEQQQQQRSTQHEQQQQQQHQREPKAALAAEDGSAGQLGSADSPSAAAQGEQRALTEDGRAGQLGSADSHSAAAQGEQNALKEDERAPGVASLSAVAVPADPRLCRCGGATRCATREPKANGGGEGHSSPTIVDNGGSTGLAADGIDSSTQGAADNNGGSTGLAANGIDSSTQGAADNNGGSTGLAADSIDSSAGLAANGNGGSPELATDHDGGGTSAAAVGGGGAQVPPTHTCATPAQKGPEPRRSSAKARHSEQGAVAVEVAAHGGEPVEAAEEPRLDLEPRRILRYCAGQQARIRGVLCGLGLDVGRTADEPFDICSIAVEQYLQAQTTFRRLNVARHKCNRDCAQNNNLNNIRTDAIDLRPWLEGQGGQGEG